MLANKNSYRKASTLALLAVVAGFLLKSAFSLPAWTQPGFNDGTSESLTIGATRTFVREGFAPSAGLPRFGSTFDSEGPISQILRQKDGLYTHFLPGAEYALYVSFRIFGDGPTGIAMSRVLPFLLLLGSAILFCWMCEVRVYGGWPWGKVITAAAIFAAPGIYSWAPSLHGHAYTSALVLLALCLGLAAREIRNFRLGLLAAFAVGFLANMMQAESMVIVSAAPLAGGLLAKDPKGTRRAFYLSACVGFGVIFAFFLHLVQVAVALDSLQLALTDQFGTALNRGGNDRWDGLLPRLGTWSKEASFTFRVGAFTMLLAGAFATWLHIDKPKTRRRTLAALILACVAGYAFPILFPRHSLTHAFRVVRVFQLEYFVFVAILVSLASNHLRVRFRLSHSRE